MGIQRLQPISITEKISPLNLEYYIGNDGWYSPGSPVICDIAGKGYIDSCIVIMQISTSNQRFGVKIEVDGATLYDVSMMPPSSTLRAMGFAIAEEWRINSNYSNFTLYAADQHVPNVTKLKNSSLPYSSIATSSDLGHQMIHLTRPIRFEQSFKVTMSFTNSIRWGYSIKGGLIV
ncbi:hypothetical protein [Parageobacillus thermoglucosidasius]|uniref:hypothetical protein n=1 Tax=Parageobacillus thermoglucosidasius TaxID=1426 RepID=UPI000E187E5D|nr:hypothetical protein [Parageobacillus thermoglucosidasius]RDE19257.1 hypothetical protein DV714_19575 [Parageobacillus thermoglucosidasius]